MKMSTVLSKIRRAIIDETGSKYICINAVFLDLDRYFVPGYIAGAGCDMSGAFGVKEDDLRRREEIEASSRLERIMFLEFLIYNLKEEGK